MASNRLNPNLGYTLNGKRIDYGAGLWDPHFNAGATARSARVTPTWKGLQESNRPTAPAKTLKPLPKKARKPAPTRQEMLARLHSGRG